MSWNPFPLLFKRLFIALLVYMACRVIFLITYWDHFSSGIAWAFLVGLRFDLNILAWSLAPYIAVSLLPVRSSRRKFQARLAEWMYFLGLLPGVILNLTDTGYFRYTEKRSGYELVEFVATLENKGDLFLTFLWSFWWLFLPGILGAWFFWSYNRRLTAKALAVPKSLSTGKYVLLALVTLCGWVLAARGGFQRLPLSTFHASRWASPQDAPLVLNTPFTFLKSWGHNSLPRLDFMVEEEVEQRWSWNQTYEKLPFQLDSNTNVVVLILESFSEDYIGYYVPGQDNTPFLDSLLRQSLVVAHGYANGRKSIEGVPAILAGIPALTYTPFLNSPHSQNHLKGLGHYFKERGYSTAFFHGAENGTMSLDALCAMTGFDLYFGRDQYPDQDDYDGNWGIWDEPYLQYVSSKLGELQPPFLAGIFTLSSHHPFLVPEDYPADFPDTLPPVLRSVRYTDQALRRFFKAASSQPWFENTLFVITADHTGISLGNHQMGGRRFAIPLAFYHKQLSPGLLNRTGQQIDIIPSILHLSGTAGFSGFGHSLFSTEPQGALGYYYDQYHLIDYPFIYRLDQEYNGYLYYLPTDMRMRRPVDSLPEISRSLGLRLKAFLQMHHRRMQQNDLLP